MNKRKYIHFIIALCLWLPLQSIAGQWIHCAQLEMSLSKLSATTVVADVVAEMQHVQSCHEVGDSLVKKSLQSDESTPQSNTIKSCKHCQFTCHFHFAILLEEASPQVTGEPPHITPFKTPSPEQPLLAQAQKPPRLLFS